MDLKKYFINQNESIKNVMRNIDRTGLRIAFIVDDKERLVGVITDGDIRRELLKGLNLESCVKEIMNKDPFIIKEEWDETEINKFLKTKRVSRNIPKHDFRRIPVVDKNNRVVDIIFASQEGFESYTKTQIKPVTKKRDIKHVNRVLVVGGAGYLGSILCRKLLEKGYLVRVLDNLTYGDHGIKDLYK
ncbi:MAG: CBS domain-containing protein, partial [Thermoplasmatales archaeon]|nr:CBS domain-containing protein [Thermoplasmatales archaeon]